MTIEALLVDDDPLVLCVTAEVLEDLGLRVHCASDGEAAIQKLASLPQLDLVIADVVMPDISGIEVAEAARRHNAHFPVVFITGFVPDALRDLITIDATTELVAKPYTPAELSWAISKVMGAGNSCKVLPVSLLFHSRGQR